MGYWDTHPVIENAPVPINTFRPAFRQGGVYQPTNDGRLTYIGYQEKYFADMATAQWIAKKYGDGMVYELPFGGEDGMGQFGAFVTANIYCTKVPRTGRFVNCGILADYYVRNPPQVAEFLINQDILPHA